MTLSSERAREIARMRSPQFTPEEITDALMACVANAGNAAAAIRSLEAQEKRAPSSGTLHEWMRWTHAARYQELRDKFSEELDQQIIHDWRDVIALATDGTKKAVQKAVNGIEDDKDPSRTAANLATVADKYTRNKLTAEGKPSRITETRDVNELLRSLIAHGVLQPPDEPAQITEAAADEQPGE